MEYYLRHKNSSSTISYFFSIEIFFKERQYARILYSYSHTSGLLSGKQEEEWNIKFSGDDDGKREYNCEQPDKVISWLGSNGWEPVSITEKNTSSVENGYTFFDQVFYFKKQIKDIEEPNPPPS